MLDDYGPYRFRPLADADAAFVRRLFHATRGAQLQLDRTGLPQEAIAALLDQQLAAQSLHFRTHHPDAEVSIIEHPDGPVARLIVVDRDDEVLLADIMVADAHRRRGICSYVMDRHVERGLASGRRIRLHVEKPNPAIALYLRKRFAVIGDAASHWLMEYRPAS